MTKKDLIKAFLALAYLVLIILPGAIFFQARGTSGVWTAADIFPLFGLYAFTLVALQLIIGPNVRLLRRFFPRIIAFHRTEGLLAFSFAVIHPLLVDLAYGPYRVLIKHSMVSPPLGKFIPLGILAAGMIYLTVGSAVAAWRFQRLTTVWRTIHLLNYAVFGLAWVHSWFIGSDVRSSTLKYVWLFYLAAYLVSVALRLKRTRLTPAPTADQSQASLAMPSDTFGESSKLDSHPIGKMPAEPVDKVENR